MTFFASSLVTHPVSPAALPIAITMAPALMSRAIGIGPTATPCHIIGVTVERRRAPDTLPSCVSRRAAHRRGGVGGRPGRAGGGRGRRVRLDRWAAAHQRAVAERGVDPCDRRPE